MFLLYVLPILIAIVSCANIERPAHPNGDEEARLFGYRYTSTAIVPKMVTSLIPSSCVQMEPSLPPCRSVRNLEVFPRFLGGYVETIDAKSVHDELLPTIHTTPLGWGEYLGIYAPTVTVTAVHLETTTVLDPRTVVTFSVKGCKPSRLPLDLHLCVKAPDAHEEIQPTQSLQQQITATIQPTIQQQEESHFLDGSQHPQPLDHNTLQQQPTEHLPQTNNKDTRRLSTRF